MSEKKGIILAGGHGTRLYPTTKTVSKQILHVYDKPMIYYPLSTLMLAGIRDILIISTPEHMDLYKNLLGDGSDFGIFLQYKIQEEPKGLAQAFILGKDFIKKDKVVLILGDNIFHGEGLDLKIKSSLENNKGATVFGYAVNNPSQFGVINFDQSGKPIEIEEKPKFPKSDYAVTGLYIYDNNVVEYAESLEPSSRGELEITDINNIYLNNKKLNISKLGRGFAWLDTGTHESLLEASQFVHVVEKRQGYKIACLEEVGMKNGWLDPQKIKAKLLKYPESSYSKYLIKVISDNESTKNKT
ncbi:MAG: glucose-1-phosphate thymidylyltransferase [Gammaproteobacteria bacterium]|nr:glucose-1-phosphate thymidylyltransferase [Gammaproteobacteria bacterium]|tara:strand:- start:281 stop:1180 length:900 start_codon:yes stop_codon:yes gene_type:complete